MGIYKLSYNLRRNCLRNSFATLRTIMGVVMTTNNNNKLARLGVKSVKIVDGTIQ
jgi:hypothetical protein